ncbi:MAG: hypothetical protein JXR25_08490 [Pontiellaceae bacterium]|nr:hypothetical protein [Pontiellaceae bacterium]MBN2784852.1 hypothetical protein [Pontiellaceae bacterium]
MSGQVRDLWAGKDIPGTGRGIFSRELPQHGAGLYRLSPVR